MTKLIAIYGKPADAAAFDRYYTGTHIPLFNTVPGLRKVSYSTAPPKSIVGEGPYLVTEAVFDSMADLDRALASPQGQAAAADLANFAQAGVSVFVYDLKDEPAFSGSPT